MPFAISNLVALLQKRVQENSERSACIFLSSKDLQQSTLTFSQLDAQARVIAGLLQSVAQRGERTLLLYPPGLDFIAAFFGCLYAGIIGVPAYPPRLNRNALRITAIAQDSEAKLALTTTAVVGRLESLTAHIPALGRMQWLATDDLPRGMAESWQVAIHCGARRWSRASGRYFKLNCLYGGFLKSPPFPAWRRQCCVILPNKREYSAQQSY